MIEFNGRQIEHRVNRRMKHCYITIDRKGNIILKTPGLGMQACYDLLERKSQWIESKLAQSTALRRVELGKEVLYRGILQDLHDESAPEKLTQALKRLRKETPEHIAACYERFYSDSAKAYLPQRVEYFAEIMGLRHSSLRFRKMKRRWGSCSSTGVITFNTYLMQAAPELIDYVIVHELAHLKHMNHSKAFHSLVQKYLPDEKERRKRLRAMEVEPYTL